MRKVIDQNGTEWEVNYIPPDTVGSGTPPNPVPAKLVFTSPDRRTVIIDPFSADIDKMKDEELLQLLYQHW